MEEKREIKISLGTVICIVIIVILLCALAFVYYLGFVKEDDKEIAKPQDNKIVFQEEKTNTLIQGNVEIVEENKEEDKKEENKQVGKIDENKELVYTEYNKYASEYSFTIPKININSQDVIAINNEIEELIKETKTAIQDESFWHVNIGYETYINGDVLSVVIDKNTGYDYTNYMVYNINIKTGKKYSNEELVSLKGFSVNEFLDKLPELYEKKFKEGYSAEDNDIINNSFYQERYNKTVSKENYGMHNPMFLDDNGNINIVGKIYKMAGGEAPYSEIIIVK